MHYLIFLQKIYLLRQICKDIRDVTVWQKPVLTQNKILLHKYFLCPKLVYEFNIVGTLKNIGHYILMVLLNAEKMRCLVLRFQKTFLFRVVLIYMNIKLTPFVSRTEFLFPNSLFLFWRHILVLSYFTEKEPQFSKSKISKSTRHVFAEHLLLVWQSLVPSVYCLWE